MRWKAIPIEFDSDDQCIAERLIRQIVGEKFEQWFEYKRDVSVRALADLEQLINYVRDAVLLKQLLTSQANQALLATMKRNAGVASSDDTVNEKTQEIFGEFFEVKEVLKPTSRFTEEEFDLPVESRRELENVGVVQYRPSVKLATGRRK